jgi:hypothetical protein
MENKAENINPIINFSEVQELMKQLGTDDKLTIVGGQALGFWGTYYYQQFPELFNIKSNELVFTTTDIDFVASSETAERCAQLWGGEVAFPEKWTETPNTAIVSIVLAGVGKIEIDFLADYERLHHVKAYFFKEIPLSNVKPIFILSAFTVFLSRLANYLNLKRDGSAGAGSLKASILVVKCHLLEKIKEQDFKFVYKHITQLLYLAGSTRHGKLVYREYKIDILDAIPDDLSALDPKFREFNMSPKVKQIQAARLPNS